jgi:hypothetical protein
MSPPRPFIFTTTPALLLATLMLAGCESSAERTARFQKEAAEAAAEAAKWQGFWTTMAWVAVSTAVVVGIYAALRYFSAANTSQRLIKRKQDYAKALTTLLHAGDYHALQAAIKQIALPHQLQPVFNQAAAKLTAVYMLFRDPRNTYVPAAVKADVLQSTRRTFEGLFSTIQRIKILQESHQEVTVANAALEQIRTNVQSITQRLDACLHDSATLILQTSPNTYSEAKSEQGLSSLENMLTALNDADRLLNAGCGEKSLL